MNPLEACALKTQGPISDQGGLTKALIPFQVRSSPSRLLETSVPGRIRDRLGQGSRMASAGMKYRSRISSQSGIGVLQASPTPFGSRIAAAPLALGSVAESSRPAKPEQYSPA